MSVFDSLKYSISDRPTYSELDNLPNDLFNEWISLSSWHRYSMPVAIRIAGWYSRAELTVDDYNDIKLLKQIIYGY